MEPVVRDGTLMEIVVDYHHDEETDTYTVKLQGELLRSPDLDWQAMAMAFRGMATDA